MKISHSDKRRVGRPSLRSFTVRRSDNHITFAAKAVNDLQLNVGTKIGIIFRNNDIFICPDSENGLKLFAFQNGQKYTSLTCTAVNIVPTILDKAKAVKVASFLIAANGEQINGQRYYKVIGTPLRID